MTAKPAASAKPRKSAKPPQPKKGRPDPRRAVEIQTRLYAIAGQPEHADEFERLRKELAELN